LPNGRRRGGEKKKRGPYRLFCWEKKKKDPRVFSFKKKREKEKNPKEE